MIRRLLLPVAVAALLSGCKGRMPEQSGFLTEYESLESSGSVTLESPADERLDEYSTFIVDPVELRLDDRSNPTPEKAQMLADQLRASVEQAIAAAPRPPEAERTARVRMALTRVRRSAPLLNLHPGTKLTGVGLGEAGIELEIVDRDSGEQLWALAAVRRGNRMTLDVFDEYKDAADAIEFWAELIGALLSPAEDAAP